MNSHQDDDAKTRENFERLKQKADQMRADGTSRITGGDLGEREGEPGKVRRLLHNALIALNTSSRWRNL